ncbi:hypothetical protein ACFP1Z_06680 [Streptomyces gamaensis]|uniref:DNA polymerase III beta sliding clamp central domain-containing protein n=1 Tax=Streptomyces gamaensis TaxID=1763542 RepID=A0ABW0YW88_9ACTN
MTTPTGLRTAGLRQAVTRVLPHMDTADVFRLDGLLLDYDGTSLFAVASDRYTLAVAAVTVHNSCESCEPWTVFLDGIEARTLAEFLNRTGFHETVTIGPRPARYDDEVPTVRATSPHESIDLDTEEWENDLFCWRAIVRTHLAGPGAGPVLLNPELLDRWSILDQPASVRLPGEHGAVTITAEHFLGLHMPIRLGSGYRGEELDWWRSVIDADRPHDDTDTARKAG